MLQGLSSVIGANPYIREEVTSQERVQLPSVKEIKDAVEDAAESKKGIRSRPVSMPSKVQTAQAAERLRQVLPQAYPELKVWIEKKTRQLVVQIIEKGTGKLIRQVPPREVVAMAERIGNLQGVIYDEEK